MLVNTSIYSILPTTSMHLPLSIPTLRIAWTIFAQLNDHDKASTRFVCRHWKQLIDNIQVLENYRRCLMMPSKVKQEASHYLRDREHLQDNQHFLLAMVKLSMRCNEMQVVAANALMILKKMHFNFINADLRGIQAPSVRLPRTHLDKVNFAGANLKGADFTSCSLNGVNFDNANLEGIELGHFPELKLKKQIITMALAPNQQQLAAVDARTLYLWNLEKLKLKISPIISSINSSKYHHLVFSHDGQWLFRTCYSAIEIWQCNPHLNKRMTLNQTGTSFFEFLALSADGKHLISIGSLKDGQRKICVWQIHRDAGSLSLTLHKERLIAHSTEYEFTTESSFFIVGLSNTKGGQHNRIEVYTLPDLDKVKTLQLRKNGYIHHMLFIPQYCALLIAISDLPKNACKLVGFFPFQKKVELKKKENINVHIWEMKEEVLRLLFQETEKIIDCLFLIKQKKERLIYITEGGSLCVRNPENKYQLEAQEKNFDYPMDQHKRLWLNKEDCCYLKGNIIVRMPLQKFIKNKTKIFQAKLQTACFSSDEQLFYAIDKRGRLYTYQVTTGKQVLCRSLKNKDANLSSLHISRFYFNYDSRHVLEAIGKREKDYLHPSLIAPRRYLGDIHALTLFDLQKKALSCHIQGKYSACAISRDGKYIILAKQKRLELWRSASKQIATVPMRFKEKITSIILSPNVFPKAILVTVEYGIENYPTKIWKINWKKQSADLLDKCSKIYNGYFINQMQLICQHDKQIRLWSYDGKKESAINSSKNSTKECVDFTKDGSLVVITEEITNIRATQLTLWNFKQKRILDRLVFPDVSFSLSAFISPHGKYVIYWHISNKLQKMYAWEIKKGKFHLLWKVPKQLEADNINLENAQKLSRSNARLLVQLKDWHVSQQQLIEKELGLGIDGHSMPLERSSPPQIDSHFSQLLFDKNSFI